MTLVGLRRRLVVNLSLFLGVALTMAPSNPLVNEPDRLSAQLTLLALQASVGSANGLSSQDLSLLSDGRVLRAEDFVEGLATAGKPLYCTASETEGRLSVLCKAATNSKRMEFFRHAGEEAVHRIRAAYPGVPNPLVRVEWSTAKLTVPLTTYQKWTADYFVDGCAQSIDFHRGGPARVGEEAHVVVRLWPSSDMHLSGEIKAR